MVRLPSAWAMAMVIVSSCCAVAAIVFGVLSVDRVNARYVLLAGVVVLGLFLCLAVPVYALPTLALIAIFVIPDRIADYSASPVVNPATVILSLWVVLKLLSRSSSGRGSTIVSGNVRLRRLLVSVVVLLGVWLIPLVFAAPVKRISIAWTFTFVVAVVAPLLIADFQQESRMLRRSLPWLGSLTAAYAVLESVQQRNYLYGPVYAALGFEDLQHWAVYRSDSSLGHPLTAGLFFAVVLAFCMGRWLETQQHRFVVAALINGLGVVSTVSRGSYVAVAVAVAVVLVAALTVRKRQRLRLAVALVLFSGAAYLAVNSNAFIERGLSTEGVNSVDVRSPMPEIAANTARAYYWLGGGPANSGQLAAPYNFQNLPIENSYLQLLIGVGVPGLALFAMILVTATLIAIRAENLSGAGALVAYATAIAGFAALDSRRDLIVLLGILILVSIHRPVTTDTLVVELGPGSRKARRASSTVSNGRRSRATARRGEVRQRENMRWTPPAKLTDAKAASRPSVTGAGK